MKLLCNHPTHVHGLDGLFPSITQDHYNAYNIEDQESVPDSSYPLKCNDLKLTLKLIHLWNQQSVISESSNRLPRDTRQVILQQSQNHENLSSVSSSAESHAHNISNEEKQRVLTTLHSYMLKTHNFGISHLFLPQEKESIRNIIMRILGRIFQTIKSVREATTRERVRESLHALNEHITKTIPTIQDVILPPLAETFENQSVSIWLDTDSLLTELSELGLEQPISQTLRMRSLTYIQALISDIEQFKSLSTGNLSVEFIRRLQAGFQERKNVLLQASRQINVAANKNQEIHIILKNLRTTVAYHARKEEFHPIFASPQLLYLRRSHLLNIPFELDHIQSQLIA